jgi:hypothetical protein
MIAIVAAMAALIMTFSISYALSGGPYVFRRAIESPKDVWVRLELPDEVLDVCRRDLADLRVVDGRDTEIPYVIAPLPEAPLSWPVRDVERSAEHETTAIVDRGEHPVLIDSIQLNIEGAEFLKPVIVESSDDRKRWSEIARASIFATRGPPPTEMTRIAFAPNDRRYLRLRLDDRNGDPVAVQSVTGLPAAVRKAAPLREIRLAPAPAGDITPDFRTYVAELPAAHLAVHGLRIETTEPAFARDVRVYERIVDRGEVSRRLVGGGRVVRGAAGQDESTIGISGPVGRTLEIEIGLAAGLELSISAFVAQVAKTAIVFHAPAQGELSLVYGSPAARAPAYDLGEALLRGPPASVAEAKLAGEPPSRSGDAEIAALTQAIPIGPGATLDSSAFRARRAITLPTTGHLAFLAVDDRPEELPSMRIVDEQNRQIPYLVEREPRLRRDPASFDLAPPPETLGIQPSASETFVRVTGIPTAKAIDAVLLEVDDDTVFSRDISVVEAIATDPHDPRWGAAGRRAPAGSRELGAARWEHLALPRGDGRNDVRGPSPFRLGIAEPRQTEIFVRIENGSNQPLHLRKVWIERVERRLVFPFSPGQNLTLLSDNPAATAPQYDLSLLAERIADLPAEPASLGPLQRTETESPAATPRWLWGAVLIAAIGITVALARTLRAPFT